MMSLIFLIFIIVMVVLFVKISSALEKNRELETALKKLEFRVAELEQDVRAPEPAHSESVKRESAPADSVTPPHQIAAPLPAEPVVQVVPESPRAPTLSESQPTPEMLEIPAPPETNSVDDNLIGLTFLRDFFTKGNSLVKVGVVLIFFGISFLLKYAADNNYLPVEARMIGAALFGISLLGIGWRLRWTSRNYALVMQGGGIGALIITTFVAFKLYGLLSQEFAFAFLVAFTLLTGTLAVIQDSRNLAVFGLLGGFLAPVLVSTDTGNHVVLFSYYALLNLGIFYVAWSKAWKVLNLLGFLFTFGIGITWGVLKYQPQHYASTQPFLAFFFLAYVGIAVLFAKRSPPELRGPVDGTIVFGNSLITIFLQTQLVKNIPYGGAFSAVILSGFYVMLARKLMREEKQTFKLIAESFLAIGIVFITLAIPLAFDGLQTSAIWALEAAGIYWVSLRQNQPWRRWFSVVIYLGANLAFFFGSTSPGSQLLFFNSFFLSCLLVTTGSYVFSYLSEKNAKENASPEHHLSVLAFLLGSLWWICGGMVDITRHEQAQWTLDGFGNALISLPFFYPNLKIVYLAVGALALLKLGLRLDWKKPRYLSHGFILPLAYFFLSSNFSLPHPLAGTGFVAWYLAFSIYYFTLKKNESLFEENLLIFRKLGHAVALWILVALLTQEMTWFVRTLLSELQTYQAALTGLVPAFLIWVISENRTWFPWPVEKHHSDYMTLGLTPICAATWYWIMITNWTVSGYDPNLPYIPILNSLEFIHVAAFGALSLWLLRLKSMPETKERFARNQVLIFLGATLFVWLNGVLCRAMHHYTDVPFHFSALFASVTVQVAFSLYWTILGIGMMMFATRRQLRWLWIVGAALLGVVVAKMFLIDLSKAQTIARVVSFLGVGILFLIVGYFSPIPPKDSASEANAR